MQRRAGRASIGSKELNDAGAVPKLSQSPIGERVGDDRSMTHDAAAAVLRARRMFDRVLAGWAFDVLQLRRAGLHTPGWPSHPDDDTIDGSLFSAL